MNCLRKHVEILIKKTSSIPCSKTIEQEVLVHLPRHSDDRTNINTQMSDRLCGLLHMLFCKDLDVRLFGHVQ